MRLVSSIVALLCLTLSWVDAYVPLPSLDQHSFSTASASRSSAPVAYGSKALRLDLKANNKLEGQPKRIHTTADGKHIETVDSVIGGCAQLDFSATVTIGAQAFSLIVDTGSTSLGVASSACSCSPATPVYTPGSTASQVDSNSQAFMSKYGDGSYWYASGYSDMVSVGSSLAAATTFASISSHSNFFKSSTCSGGTGSQSQGIMGFAGSQIAVRDSNTGVVTQQWFAQYQQAAQVPDIFALQMCVVSGDLWLGGYDNTTFSGQLHWVNIQPLTISSSSTFTIQPGNGYYTIAVNSIGLTGFTADSTSSDYQGINVNTIVDSGTTLMILPTAAYNAIVSALTTNYNSQFSNLLGVSASTFFANRACYPQPSGTTIQSINSALPTLEVKLGGAANNEQLNITLYAASSYLQQAFSGGTTYYCVGIADRGSSSTTNILGWSFINQLIVAHDLRNLKMGFALRTGCRDGSTGAYAVAGGEINVADAAIQGGSVTSTGAAGGGSNNGNNIFSSISGLSTTVIIIIVVSVVAGIIVLLALCWCCQSQKSTGQHMQEAIQAQQMQEFGKI